MECKFCHAVIEDDAQFCPLCGKSLIEEAAETPAEEPVAETEAAVEEVAAEETAVVEEAAEEISVEGAEDVPAEEVEETPAEDAEETPAEDTEDAAEEPVEEEAVPETPKKRHGVLFAILGVLLAAIIAGAVYLSQQAKIPAERVTLSGATSYTVENGAMTQETADRVVASSKKNNLFEQAKTMLGATAPAKDGLTNAQLALFYWENFYNYYNQNYYYAMYLGLDPQNMATSMYDEEANRTWQEYFLSNALEDYRTYTAACAKAKAEKFEIPAEIAENLKTIRDSIAERGDEELN
ncbi:MAG: zinc ribbon domain-containing protein, partial [Oscillospiraceae bacterium]|nr:zinc ribbon domain-containing protein [Oscillospiraceae bacterium]